MPFGSFDQTRICRDESCPLYSLVGSAMVLIGLIARTLSAGGKTNESVHTKWQAVPLSAAFSNGGISVGYSWASDFGRVMPFHTWLPRAMSLQPTAASGVLAGVVMKLGAITVCFLVHDAFPRGLDPLDSIILGFGSWRDIYRSSSHPRIGLTIDDLSPWCKKDFKFVVGYSRVSAHGFVRGADDV